MPAGSDLPPLPRTWRSMGTRFMSIGLAAGIFVIGAVTWISFDDETQAMWSGYQKGTVLLMYLGVVVAVWCLARCRLTATEEGVVIVNGFRRREYEWAELVAISMGPGAPWASIDLADGDVVSVVGIQATDGRRARQAVEDLREYAAQHGPAA